ncbi:MAG: zinc dependent phospholipase C family protein [Niabella sp.]
MKKKFIFSTLLVIIVITLGSWGFLVHRTINQLAIYELPKGMQPFFYIYKDYLVYNAPRADIRRNTDKEEGHKHYIDMEYFGTDPFKAVPQQWDDAVAKYGLDTLKAYGTLPYTVIETQKKLTEAFRSKNKDSILFYAADLGHYIGDAHVPLHTSINYDGQLTNQRGMHDLWETTVPEIVITSYHINSGHKAKYIPDITKRIWEIIAHTHSLVPNMFEQELVISKNFQDTSKKYRWQERWGKMRRFYSTDFAKAYNAALKGSINEQLIASANHLADFWYTAWVDAGKPDLSGIMTKPYQKKDFKKEQKAFKKNQLIKKGLLISKQKPSND